MLSHPESLRFCGFQNVTLNIPQAAYRAARKGEKNLDGLWRELEGTMETAVLAHLEKKAKTAEMMSSPGRPLYQIGRPACDGRPYVELDNCTYILGLIGLNDALKFLYGAEMHENEDILELGLRLVSRMYLKTKELSERHGLKFSLEESPAESAARRLARTDLVYFPEAKGVIKGGSEEVAYYTNSIHLAPEAQTSLTQRIRLQSKFHSLIESGAIIHAFVGEQRPEPASVAALVSNTFYLTQAAQLTISPEFTHCRSCEEISRGLHECCPGCGSSDVAGETRVVGYFSKIENWNKSKRYGELLDRHRGQYAVETLHGQPALSEMMEIRNTEDSADEQEIPPERLRKDWVRQVQGA
jgi:ribonucleoside-triphosphate reductase